MLKKIIFIFILIYTYSFSVTIKNRDQIINEVLFHEGETIVNKTYELSKYGIRDIVLDEYNSKYNTTYTVKSLTKNQAKKITEYLFLKYRMDEINDIQLQLLIFDIFFNAGSKSGATITQKALKKYTGLHFIENDGILGTQTIKLINEVLDLDQFANILTNERIEHYKNLGRWSRYGRGWEKRILALRSKVIFPKVTISQEEMTIQRLLEILK